MNTSVKCLVIRFLLLLRPSKIRILDAIKRDYGRTKVKSVLGFTALLKKREKCNLDLEFLLTCKTYDIFPRFLRFKLYKKSLQSTRLYKSWQQKLLEDEIKFKRRRYAELTEKCDESRRELRQSLSFFKFYWLITVTQDILRAYKEKHESIHGRKLHHLGISNSLQQCDPNKVILNLSSKPIPARIRTL